MRVKRVENSELSLEKGGGEEEDLRVSYPFFLIYVRYHPFNT